MRHSVVVRVNLMKLFTDIGQLQPTLTRNLSIPPQFTLLTYLCVMLFVTATKASATLVATASAEAGYKADQMCTRH